jgi:hypothetical protein
LVQRTFGFEEPLAQVSNRQPLVLLGGVLVIILLIAPYVIATILP